MITSILIGTLKFHMRTKMRKLFFKQPKMLKKKHLKTCPSINRQVTPKKS